LGALLLIKNLWVAAHGGSGFTRDASFEGGDTQDGPIEEIAGHMGLTKSAVLSRLHRARQKLRVALGAGEGIVGPQ
jgi:hypothetical protein